MVGSPVGVEFFTIEREGKFKEFKGHTGPVISLLHVKLQDQNLYSASLDNTIRCWDAYDMSCLGAFHERKAELSCLAYLPGSIILLTGHDDGSIKLWNIDSGSSMVLEHHANTVSCLTIAHAKRRDFLISGSFDKTIGIWDLSKRRAFNPLPEHTLVVSQEEVICVCHDPFHDNILTAGNDKLIHIWNLWTHEKMGVLKGHKDGRPLRPDPLR